MVSFPIRYAHSIGRFAFLTAPGVIAAQAARTHSAVLQQLRRVRVDFGVRPAFPARLKRFARSTYARWRAGSAHRLFDAGRILLIEPECRFQLPLQEHALVQ